MPGIENNRITIDGLDTTLITTTTNYFGWSGESSDVLDLGQTVHIPSTPTQTPNGLWQEYQTLHGLNTPDGTNRRIEPDVPEEAVDFGARDIREIETGTDQRKYLFTLEYAIFTKPNKHSQWTRGETKTLEITFNEKTYLNHFIEKLTKAGYDQEVAKEIITTQYN